MTNKRITSTSCSNGERAHKGLLSIAERVEKLKPKALKALTRKIMREEKADFPYQQFLPDGIANKRDACRYVTRIIKNKTYKYLELPVHHNYTWDSEDILDVVVEATVRHSCIEDASNSLNLRKPRKIKNLSEMESRPNGDTVLRRIKKVSTVEWMDRFSKANHNLLKALVKARVFQGFVWAALDITPWMFYGDKNTSGVMGTKRQKGSNYAFKYMTVCVTAQREHVTLAGSYMTQLMNPQKLMKELILRSLRYINGKIGVICDREFFTVDYIKVLYELDLKFLMPAQKNNRIKKIIKETKDYPRVVRYPMGTGENKVEFWLFLVKNKKGEVHAFATNMAVDEKNAEKLAEFYRNRWTIETSYSMLSEVRARTCSRNFSLRWFFVLFGLLVRNGYYLCNEVIIHYGHITLKTFAELISEAELEDIPGSDDNPTDSNRNGMGDNMLFPISNEQR